MKICKACDTEYRDELNSCPMCGSNKYYSEAEIKEEEERHKKEVENYKRSVGQGSKLKYRIRMAAAALILLLLVSVSAYFIVQKVQYNREIQYLYESGQYSYENGDLEDAISLLSSIPKNSKYYKSAQEMINDACDRYIAELEKSVARCLKEKDYGTAMELVDNARYVLPDDKMIEPLYKDVAEKYKAYVLAKAKKYAEKKQYSKAVVLLEEACGYLDSDSELEAALLSYRNKYRDAVIKKAKKKLDTEGYEEAMDVLLKAKEILKDDEQLDKTIDKFRTYQPEYLYEIEPYEVNRYARIGNGGFVLDKDNYGNHYTEKGVISAIDYMFNADKGVVRYNLEKQYNVLQGTIFVPYESRNVDEDYDNNSSSGTTKIWIYGDGKKLYTAKQIFETDKPYKFTVDISGVEFLEIRVSGGWYKGNGTGLIPHMCIGELAVSKR